MEDGFERVGGGRRNLARKLYSVCEGWTFHRLFAISVTT